MAKIIYADEVNYWKSGKSSPDTWMEKSKKELNGLGATIHIELSGTVNGKTVFTLGFRLDGDEFRISYPVLKVRDSKDEYSAKRQAATALYHEVKALCVSAKFRGVRGAFHSFLVLPDGRTAGDLTAPEISEAIPMAFRLPAPKTDSA